MGSQKKTPDHITKNPLESNAAAFRMMSIPAINVSMNAQSARGGFGWKRGDAKGTGVANIAAPSGMQGPHDG